MLSVLSWNIQAGSGSRVRSVARAIGKKGAEIVVLSEYRNNETGVKLRSLLMEQGYRHQVVTHAERNANSVLIVSKLPFHSELYPKSDPEFSANIVTAHFSAFSVMGVYLPHKKKHTLLPFMTNVVATSDVPYIIAGDYNTGKNYIDQAGNSFWYTDELLALEKAGYQDAFRLVYPEVKEYSWYSHQGNGYRYDHTYIAKELAPIVADCHYIHDWREDKLSDHSPMVLTLGNG